MVSVACVIVAVLLRNMDKNGECGLCCLCYHCSVSV